MLFFGLLILSYVVFWVISICFVVIGGLFILDIPTRRKRIIAIPIILIIGCVLFLYHVWSTNFDLIFTG